MRAVKVLFLTGLGSGLIPFAPGTFGSLVGVLLYVAILAKLPKLLALLAFAVVFFWAVRLSNESRSLFGEEDSSRIVIDEILGMWVALWGNPLSLWCVVDGFLLFRFFDIYKPELLRKLERLPGGWGVVLDDVAAGVLANIVLRLMF